jgi:hypothetical protein
MKNFIILILLIAVASGILQLFLPWWVISIICFVSAYLVPQKSLQAFLAGFAGIFLLWVAVAFNISHANNNLLAHKVAELLPLGGHTSLLLLVTGIVGGLVAAMSALSGSLARKAFG